MFTTLLTDNSISIITKNQSRRHAQKPEYSLLPHHNKQTNSTVTENICQ